MVLLSAQAHVVPVAQEDLRLDMPGEASIVHFPHPGAEHRPGRGDTFAWNHGKHARKFLRSRGAFVDGASKRGNGELVFWGEWEPPSTITRRWPKSGALPECLHSPWWERPSGDGPRQNTDPWVFGGCFYYSNCRQLTSGGRPSALQNLKRGSLILFGSTVSQEFVVDTVFVVSDAEQYALGEGVHGVDESFRTCTIESLATKHEGHSRYTLYRAATVDSPVEGMFSSRSFAFPACLPLPGRSSC